MKIVNLHDGWTLRPAGGPVPDEIRAAGPIPATVPGSVHTDLLAAGLIPDPYLDDHERRLAWIGLADWRYETVLDWPLGAAGDPDRVQLVFEGLDTVARVELNGEPVATTANMHRTYRIDVSDRLRPGENRLAVTFSSAIRYADAMSLTLGARPHVIHHPYNAIRKAAYSFGWDWGPDLVGAGIWRPVRLHAWCTARLASVRPVTTVEGDAGMMVTHVAVERAGDAGDLVVEVEAGGVSGTATIAAGADAGAVELRIPAVRRWWPRGYGDQALYAVTVRLRAPGADEVLDEWRGRVGFRTVRLDQSRDEAGTGFTFVINDQPITVKGVNWIPDDVFPHRSRYAERIGQAIAAGVNLIRVWGGGIYEDDEFYRLCDERGVLVWQDFAFSCATYAEEEPLRSEILAEATDNITRLMPHPSLVLWNGNNENLWGMADWGWRERLDGRTWGHAYYFDLLPGLVAQLDGTRPYTPGSPCSPDPGQHPNDPAHGTVHIWDVWNQLDYTAYRTYRPRFVAEFGWQGPPAWTTLRRAISDDPLTPESPGMLIHQKAIDGDAKLTRGLVPHLRVPQSMVDWHWAMALNQARAVRTGVEWFRSLHPLCTGTILWQLNDCWPVVSWSMVDSDGRCKPAFYALRRAYADRLVTVQPSDDGLWVALVNDTAHPWSGTLAVSRRSYDGAVLATEEIVVSVAARSTERVEVPRAVATPDQPGAELLVAEFHAASPGGPGEPGSEQRGLWFFAEDRDSALPAPRFSATVTPVAGGAQVTVTAQTLLRDLALLADRAHPDATVDDMFATLLPGESVTWTVRCPAPLDPDRLLAPDVLRSANQLVQPSA
jgi:beta-mannosidase